MNCQNRRESDHKRTDIERMILAEYDIKNRSFLIILNSINDSLVANTRLTQDVAGKLDKHLTAFEKTAVLEAERRNKQAGMAKIGMYVLGVLQVMLSGSVGYLMQEFKELRQTDSELRQSITKTDSELRQIATKNATRIDGHDTQLRLSERKP